MKLFKGGGVVAAAVTIAAIGGFAGAASAACQLQTIAEFPLTIDGKLALVDATVNGRSLRLLVDTGSYTTIITRSAAADMGLTLQRVSGLQTFDVNGVDETDMANIREFKLGGITAHDFKLVVTAKGLDSDRFQGMLGANFLAQADLELDYAHKVMRFFKPVGCAGDQVVYWGAAYSVLPIQPSNDPDALNVYLALNGQRVEAKLDTGASETIVTSQMAARVGASAGFDPTVSTFASVGVGDETIKNTRLQVIDLFAKDTETPTDSHLARKLGELPDMLLGADFVSAHHIYIARSQGKIYFSYNGGSIFSHPAAAAAAPPAPTPPAPPPTSH
jgi:predicted aspartyl protease